MAGGQVVWQDENRHPTMTVDEARRTFRDVVLGLEYCECLRSPFDAQWSTQTLSHVQYTTRASFTATSSQPTCSGPRTTPPSRSRTLACLTCQKRSCVHLLSTTLTVPRVMTTRPCARLLAVQPSLRPSCVILSSRRLHLRLRHRTRAVHTLAPTRMSRASPSPSSPRQDRMDFRCRQHSSRDLCHQQILPSHDLGP